MNCQQPVGRVMVALSAVRYPASVWVWLNAIER